MSPHSITLDDFLNLDRKAIAIALRLFQQELDGTLNLIATDEEARKDEKVLDELTTVLTLRKVFRDRLAELEEEENYVPALSASEQYSENERQPLLT
jgi:hypothetical protein